MGVDARAAIGDLGSMVIHDRSGAAVTAAEFPRLRPFIPLPTDDNATVKKKLSRFVAEYTAINNELRGMFSADQGYRTADKASNDGGEIGTKAKAAFGAYEPDKYTYGANPKTGKFARKARGAIGKTLRTTAGGKTRPPPPRSPPNSLPPSRRTATLRPRVV